MNDEIQPAPAKPAQPKPTPTLAQELMQIGLLLQHRERLVRIVRSLETGQYAATIEQQLRRVGGLPSTVEEYMSLGDSMGLQPGEPTEAYEIIWPQIGVVIQRPEGDDAPECDALGWALRGLHLTTQVYLRSVL